MTRARHRVPVSYHLLCDALMVRGSGEVRPFARAVRRIVQGFVTHEQYAAVARNAAHQLPARRMRRQLAEAVALDANPIAGLFSSCGPAGHFESRWNALNQAAHFGVKTHLERYGAADGRMGRTLVDGARDEAFRAEVITQLVDVLAGGQAAIADDAQAVVKLAERLEAQDPALREVLALLHAEPDLSIERCAARLGNSLRTLQRQLARQGLLFTQLKQAVRITVAGWRMRHGDESLTAIAQAAGFFDSAHLVHAWQAACGVSPSAYRAIARLAV